MAGLADFFISPIQQSLNENRKSARFAQEQQVNTQKLEMNNLAIEQKQRQMQAEQGMRNEIAKMPPNLSPMQQLSYLSVAAARAGDFNAMDKTMAAQGQFMARMAQADEYKARTATEQAKHQITGLDLISKIAPMIHSQQELDQALEQYGLGSMKGQIQYSPETMQQLANLAINAKDQIRLKLDAMKTSASIQNMNNEILNRNTKTANEALLNNARIQKIQEEIKHIGVKGGSKGSEVAMGAPTNTEINSIGSLISSFAPGQTSRAPMLAGQIKEYQRKNPALSWQEATDRVMPLAIQQGMFGPPEAISRIYNQNLLKNSNAQPAQSTDKKEPTLPPQTQANTLPITPNLTEESLQPNHYYVGDGHVYFVDSQKNKYEVK